MSRIIRLFIVLLTACALQVAAPALAQTIVPKSDGPWTHRVAKVTFPQALGNANRTQITEFDEDGSDASVGYNLVSDAGVLVLTIYVYPHAAGYPCGEIFEDARSHIAKYKGSRLTSEWSAASPAGGGADNASVARYFVPEGSMREGIPAMYSDLYLYCSPGDKWLVKYRASWSGKAEQFPDVGALLQQIAWPADLD